ncbi:2-aminoadipate transaminase-like [Branchiostoma floridae x Branchiostoma belcheri]
MSSPTEDVQCKVDAKDAYDEQNMFENGRINLQIGAPAYTILQQCASIMRVATEHRMTSEEKEGFLFQYGPRNGDIAYRKELASFLTRHYRYPVDSSSLVVTAGATQGLYMLASLLFNRGDVVFVEDPTYFIGFQILKTDLGLKTISVPMDEEGISVDMLDGLLEEQKKSSTVCVTEHQPFWTMLYLIPTFHNPTGRCLSQRRCRQLVQVARKHHILVVCDDVYNTLCYEKDSQGNFVTPPPALISFDQETDPGFHGNVVSNGSFSKILSPGLRLGWIQAPKKIRSLIMNSSYCDSGGAFNNYTSGIIASALQLGLVEQNLGKIQEIYARNMNAVHKIIIEEWPTGVSCLLPKGGFFIWVEFPQGFSCTELKKICIRDHNVSFYVGSICSPQGLFENCLRVCFALYDLETLTDAVRKIGQCARLMMETT